MNSLRLNICGLMMINKLVGNIGIGGGGWSVLRPEWEKYFSKNPYGGITER